MLRAGQCIVNLLICTTTQINASVLGLQGLSTQLLLSRAFRKLDKITNFEITVEENKTCDDIVSSNYGEGEHLASMQK